MCIDVNNNHLNIATVTKLVQRLQKGKTVETKNVSRLSSKKYYIQIFRHSCFEKRLEKGRDRDFTEHNHSICKSMASKVQDENTV